MSKSRRTNATITFEAQFERLQEIAAKLNTETLPIDEMVILYEEALQHLEFCLSYLQTTQGKVDQLRKKGEHLFELLDFTEPGS